jgi:hypothetical protein
MLHIMSLQMRRTARSALVAAAFLGLSACGSDAPTGPSNKGLVTGTYTLEEVDDEALPVAVHRGAYWDPDTGEFWNNYLVEVQGGYIEVREDETFYIALQLRVNADGQTAQGTLEMEGEWDEVKDEVILRIHAPFEAITSLGREGNKLHTDLDMGFGEEFHFDFMLWKRS